MNFSVCNNDQFNLLLTLCRKNAEISIPSTSLITQHHYHFFPSQDTCTIHFLFPVQPRKVSNRPNLANYALFINLPLTNREQKHEVIRRRKSQSFSCFVVSLCRARSRFLTLLEDRKAWGCRMHDCSFIARTSEIRFHTVVQASFDVERHFYC